MTSARRTSSGTPPSATRRREASQAYDFLLSLGWDEGGPDGCACILTHRYRSDRPPQSIEAKLLFDADKLDVTGAIGIARYPLLRRGSRQCALLPG